MKGGVETQYIRGWRRDTLVTPKAGQSCERNVVLREEVDATHAALEYAEVPLPVAPHTSRGLYHRPTAVRTGRKFRHGFHRPPRERLMFRPRT
jgi:hypothetical protein